MKWQKVLNLLLQNNCSSFSLPELKPQVSFSDRLVFMVCLSVCPPVICLKTFHIFIFFSRITRPISTKLGTKHPWVKGIQVCTNKGPHLFPRGDNYEISKIHCRLLKSYSPEPLGQFQPNFAQSILGWMEFKFIQMKCPALFKSEIITE